jgi:hypothetical protein
MERSSGGQFGGLESSSVIDRPSIRGEDEVSEWSGRPRGEASVPIPDPGATAGRSHPPKEKLMNVLCRHAPTWIGTLERPSPMHLAEAIVLDHPDKYETRDAEGQTVESGE